MTVPSLSVVLPAFNEAGNLPATVTALSRALRQLRVDYEIIVVNDGSTDETKIVCERLRESEEKLRLFSHETNLGYGAALRAGFNLARYEFVYLTDADGQLGCEHIADFLAESARVDAVVGYRATRADPEFRRILSRIGNVIARTAFALRVRDVNCAAKLLRRDRLASLTLQSNGAMISSELLYRARQESWRIVELPVNHFQRIHGRATGARLDVLGRTIVEFLLLATSSGQRIPQQGATDDDSAPARLVSKNSIPPATPLPD